MADGAQITDREALEAAAWALPLEQVNPAQPALFAADAMWPYFERLRREDPVHFTAESDYGPYWSITRYDDIMAVDANHQAFSSDWSRGGIAIQDDAVTREPLPMFIAMDPPRHDDQRKAVSPAFSSAALRDIAPLIRERAGRLLYTLPIDEPFDWVERVSVELTAMTLATLFDVPQEDRLKLPHWSNVATATPGYGVVDSVEDKVRIMGECQAYFADLWNARVDGPPRGDLISMLAQGAAQGAMSPQEVFGNIVLLTVGGNDTTRNTITGSVLALSQNPDQYDRLRADPSLIPSMVSEAIRWQTPLAHMRRTSVVDCEVGGKRIPAGSKVVMWYVSGNRDETVIDNADAFVIDRERPRAHLSFGFGIHRCVGSRLAELQLTIVWEEILKRFPTIEVIGEPRRFPSTFVRGYLSLPTAIPRRH